MSILNFLESVNSFIWGGGLIFLLLSAGIMYTVRLGFIQLRLFPFIFGKIRSCKGRKSAKGKSQLRTVCMSLGTAMGTGNITGVASALVLGGPGAIFWMWISAFFGMALVYAENYLASVYKKDSSCCGPYAYISFGVGSPLLAVFFSFCCILASLGMGGMVQVSSFADSLRGCVSFNPCIVAVIIFVIIFSIVKGGAVRIGSAAQILLPIAAVSYSVVAIIIIFSNARQLPYAFSAIFSEAFRFESAAGGFSGFMVSKAVSAGIRRGIFSNEAGLGSSPILHSEAADSSPVMQGMCSMFEVFFDTVICCTLTALVLLTATDTYSVQEAFSAFMGNYSDIFITAVSAIFALCTVIGWYYCGERAFVSVFGKSKVKAFTVFFSAASALGAVFTVHGAWTLSDIFNGLMAIPNLLALFILAKKVKRE